MNVQTGKKKHSSGPQALGNERCRRPEKMRPNAEDKSEETMQWRCVVLLPLLLFALPRNVAQQEEKVKRRDTVTDAASSSEKEKEKAQTRQDIRFICRSTIPSKQNAGFHPYRALLVQTPECS